MQRLTRKEEELRRLKNNFIDLLSEIKKICSFDLNYNYYVIMLLRLYYYEIRVNELDCRYLFHSLLPNEYSLLLNEIYKKLSEKIAYWFLIKSDLQMSEVLEAIACLSAIPLRPINNKLFFHCLKQINSYVTCRYYYSQNTEKEEKDAKHLLIISRNYDKYLLTKFISLTHVNKEDFHELDEIKDVLVKCEDVSRNYSPNMSSIILERHAAGNLVSIKKYLDENRGAFNE